MHYFYTIFIRVFGAFFLTIFQNEAFTFFYRKTGYIGYKVPQPIENTQFLCYQKWLQMVTKNGQKTPKKRTGYKFFE
jgi:hypothetical protein